MSETVRPIKGAAGGGTRHEAAQVIRSFRPEASDVQRLLLKRRQTPVIPGKTARDEARLCALYVTDSEFTLGLLRSRLGVARDRVKTFLTAWGVSWQDRSIVGVAFAPSNAQMAA
jgi:hypothetical protein